MKNTSIFNATTFGESTPGPQPNPPADPQPTTTPEIEPTIPPDAPIPNII